MPFEWEAPAPLLMDQVHWELSCYRTSIGRTEDLSVATTNRVTQGDEA